MDQNKRNSDIIFTHLRCNNIKNYNILKAFANNPRNKFFSDEKQPYAYLDSHVEIDHHIYQMSPLLFANMMENISIKKTESVLEIGSGAGFNAAVISELCSNIDSIYLHESNIKLAKEFLSDKEVENCKFYKEIPAKKYDVLFISGKLENFGKYLQYLDDIGRGIAILGNKEYVLGDLVMFYKNNNNVAISKISSVCVYNLDEYYE